MISLQWSNNNSPGKLPGYTYNEKSVSSYFLKSEAFAFKGTRLQGSYLNLRHGLLTRTMPRLMHKASSSFRRVAYRQYVQLRGIFFRNSIARTSSVFFTYYTPYDREFLPLFLYKTEIVTIMIIQQQMGIQIGTGYLCSLGKSRYCIPQARSTEMPTWMIFPGKYNVLPM